MDCIPGHHNEAVESVPRVRKVCRLRSLQSHCGHFDYHFDGEKCKYQVIKYLECFASRSRTVFVFTRLIHAQSDAVEQDRYH